MHMTLTNSSVQAASQDPFSQVYNIQLMQMKLLTKVIRLLHRRGLPGLFYNPPPACWGEKKAFIMPEQLIRNCIANSEVVHIPSGNTL